MKRSRVGLDDVAEMKNLLNAFGKAALGKRGRQDVENFRMNLEVNLSQLGLEIRRGNVTLSAMRSFTIHDPKRRVIHAPAFRDRVLHHALANVIAPRLDRSLIDQTFACRTGKGAHAAARHAQTCLRRSGYYGQIDIAHYFPSIPHDRLISRLERMFSDHDLLDLIAQIIRTGSPQTGYGLPIGALTSQMFANVYLSPVDRAVTCDKRTSGYLRYMDDMVWFCVDRHAVQHVMQGTIALIERDLKLVAKRPRTIAPSISGLSFCGYRIHQHRLLLSRRRKRYGQARRQAEAAFVSGIIDAATLQRRMDEIIATTLHSDSTAWRRHQMRLCPVAQTVQDA